MCPLRWGRGKGQINRVLYEDTSCYRRVAEGGGDVGLVCYGDGRDDAGVAVI